MKIIILGMDNTGKTTLAEELSKKLQIVHLVSGGPKVPCDKMKEELHILLSIENFIQERCSFFEEMVYGSILRKHSNFSFRDKEFVEELKNVNIIYCRPNKRIIKNWQQREQMEGVIDNSDKLLKQFDKVIKKARLHGLNIIKYNYKKESVTDVISKLQ